MVNFNRRGPSQAYDSVSRNRPQQALKKYQVQRGPKNYRGQKKTFPGRKQ
jgi:hypothetical protein